MFLIELEYPPEAEEVIQIARMTTGDALLPPVVTHLMTPAEIHRSTSSLVRRDAGARSYLRLRGSPGAEDTPQRRDRPRHGSLLARGSGMPGPRRRPVPDSGCQGLRAALLGSYMVRLEDIQEAAVPPS